MANTRFDRLQQAEGMDRSEIFGKRINPTIQEVMRTFRAGEKVIMDDLSRLLFDRHGSFATAEEAEKWLASKSTAAERNMLLRRAGNMPEPYRTAWLKRIQDPAFQTRLTNRMAVNTVVDINGEQIRFGVDKTMTRVLSGVVVEGMNRQMFALQKGLRFGWDVSQPSQQMIDAVLRRSYSETSLVPMFRRWGQPIKESLVQGIVSGQGQRDIVKGIQAVTGDSLYDVKRMVRTELTWASSEGELEALKQADIEQYQFIATLDEKTCPICGGLDGDTFPVDKAVVGDNRPPAHPNCRCVLGAALTDEKLQKLKRRYRDPDTGKNKLIPANITWKDWSAEFLH